MVRAFLSIAAVLVSATVAVVTPSERVNAQSSQPNVLLIVTDDQRADSLGVMPATRRWLRTGGTRFTNAFATTPLCCPSRGSILTGLMAHNHGLIHNRNDETDMVAAQSLMMQRALRAAGYNTGLFGKYLNGWPLNRNPAGWDRWSTTPTVRYSGAEWNIDGTVRSIGQHSTRFIANQTLRFLDEADSLDDTRPWFGFVGFHAPHIPAEVPGAFADLPVPPLITSPSMRERDLRDKPFWLRSASHARRSQILGIRRRQLRSLIHLDRWIDRIMGRLRNLGELRNTLVIYTSDNGYQWGDHGMLGKHAPYDASIRVPLLVRWDGHVERGGSRDRLVALLDLAPTILDAAGASLPHQMDGVDLMDDRIRRRLPLEYWRGRTIVPTWRAVLQRRAMYVEYLDETGTLTGREYYDLRRDPYQLVNVLRDGIPGNEPDLDRLHGLVLRLSRCAGDGCLD